MSAPDSRSAGSSGNQGLSRRARAKMRHSGESLTANFADFGFDPEYRPSAIREYLIATGQIVPAGAPRPAQAPAAKRRVLRARLEWQHETTPWYPSGVFRRWMGEDE